MALPDKRWRAAPAAGALGALALIGVAACTPPEDPSHGDAGGGAVAVAEPPLGPYVPFPAGWGFPRDRGTLEGWVDDVDIADIREWGWTLFAGVNQPAGHDGLTVWQTWWRVTQTFAPAPRPGPVGAEAAVAESESVAGRDDDGYYALANLRTIQASASGPIPHTPNYTSTCGDGVLFANNGDIMIAGEIL